MSFLLLNMAQQKRAGMGSGVTDWWDANAQPGETDATKARRELEARGISTAGRNDAEVLDFYNGTVGTVVGNLALNAYGGVQVVAENLNPLNWQLLGIELKYWLIVGAAIYFTRR